MQMASVEYVTWWQICTTGSRGWGGWAGLSPLYSARITKANQTSKKREWSLPGLDKASSLHCIYHAAPLRCPHQFGVKGSTNPLQLEQDQASAPGTIASTKSSSLCCEVLTKCYSEMDKSMSLNHHERTAPERQHGKLVEDSEFSPGSLDWEPNSTTY